MLVTPAGATPHIESRPAGAVTVETVSDYRTFLEIEADWNDLTESSGIDHPFLNHEWVRTWWECFGGQRELHIVLVKIGGETVAIAPLMAGSCRLYGMKFRQVESIANRHTPRFDLILGRHPETACRAIWSYLASRAGAWDVLRLCELPAGSPALAEIERRAAEDGFLVGSHVSAESPYLNCSGMWEGYVQRLRHQQRASMRNQLSRLSRLGRIGLEMISSGNELGRALQDALRIEAAGWKWQAGSAILSRQELKLFYSRLAERAARRGWLRLLFLTLDDARLAVAYALCYKNRLYMLKWGCDPRYAPYAPFNVLCHLVLRECFERGISEYDFLGGADPWKLDWAQAIRRHQWLFVFRKSFRARIVHAVKFGLLPRFQRYRSYFGLQNVLVGYGLDVRSFV